MEFPQMNLSPEDVERTRQTISQSYTAVIRMYRNNGKFEVKFVPHTPQAEAYMPTLVGDWVNQMAAQMSGFLGIQGEIEDVE